MQTSNKCPNFLIDTGSDLSLLKVNFLNPNVKIDTGKTRTLLGISNNPVKTLGQIKLEFVIANKIFPHTFHIVSENFPIKVNGVIGNDFLTINHAILNYNSNKLVLNNTVVSITCERHYNGSKNKLIAAPRSETVVPIEVIGDLKEGLFEAKEAIPGVYFPAAILKADQDNIAITTILNTTDEEVSIENVSTILKPISEEPETSNVFNIYEKYSNNDVDPNQRFQRILESLRLDHLCKNEKDTLTKIFSKYRELFHLEGESLTSTNTVQHEIHTKTEAPITSRIYKYPHHFKKIVNNEIDELLNQGIIKPSNSAWNSPV